jgi:hypothetical protein
MHARTEPEIVELAALASASNQRPVWLRVGQVIDGASERPLKHADVVLMRRRFDCGDEAGAELLRTGSMSRIWSCRITPCCHV